MDINGQRRTNSGGIMTLAETASYLKVSEKTVLRMIRDKKIPCAKVAGQWRFLRTVLDDWLLSRMNAVQENDLCVLVKTDNDSVPLSRLLRTEFILMDLEPGPKKEVLEQLVKPFMEHGIVKDDGAFVERLYGREKMVSTAIARGVALPHARRPSENPPGGPLLCIGICKEGTDFDSLDGKPTRLFFLVYTDSELVHLRVMAKLTGLLRNEETVKRIIRAAGPGDVLNTVIEEDQRVLTADR
ncbi:MAG: PTS sugar transporter subunit IIA [Spirochaetes bacterium]|nr:PTS sugar transporter subunit IIA [Spirochaetota bacterium]